MNPSGFEPTDLWSTPSSAPLVPPFPIHYRGVRILTAVYRSDPTAIARHLPRQLDATSDLVMVHLYDMPSVPGMGAVTECNVMVGATVRDRPEVSGGFTTALYISSDAGLAQGREVHGQPKKLGTTTIQTRGDLVVGSVRRNGIRIIRITTPFRTRSATLADISAHFPFATNLNAKIIANIDGTPAVNQITSRTLREVSVADCWAGPATVELQCNAQAPVHLLPVLEAVAAYEWYADFTLQEGEIVLDLLGGAST